MGLFSDRRRVGTTNIQEVEYLEVSEESEGYPYIVTNYIPTGDDIKVETTFTFLGYNDNSAYTAWFSAYTSENSELYRIIRYNTSNDGVLIHNGGEATSLYLFSVLKGTTYNIVLDGNKGNINGTKFNIPQIYTKPNINPFNIFSKGNANYPTRAVYGRFYFFKVSKADKVVLDLIPVRVGNEGFMYDKVSGKLYGNSGDGRFILGPDVTKPYDKEVEYLEVNEGSNGMPMIDTEYIPQGQDIAIYCDFMPLGWHGTGNYSTMVFIAYTDENTACYRMIKNNNATNSLLIQNSGFANSIYRAIVFITMGTRYNMSLFHNEVDLNGSKFDIPVGGVNNNTNSLKFTGRLSSTHYGLYRLYSFRLDKAGVTQLDLIPVRKDGVGYMYDKVSGKLFGNANTDGSRFIIGPDIN